MKFIRLAMLLLAIMIVGKAVAMLPPEVFKDPIFASNDSSDEGQDSDRDTEFA